MDELGGHLLLEALRDPLAVRIIVCVGLGALSIAFGVLMWSQREAADSLHQAIALSVFAHLLILTFCYSTNIIPLPPGPGGEGSPIELTLNGAEVDDPNIENAKPGEEFTTEEKPWETPAAEQPVAPPIAPAERPAVEPQEVTPEKAPITNPLAASLPDTPIAPPAEDPPAAPAIAETVPRDDVIAEPPPPEAIAETPVAPSEPTPAALPAPASPPTPRAAIASAPPTASTEVPTKFASNVNADAIPAMLRNRFASNRKELVRRGGGDERTEAAVQAALKWLAAHQSPDGSWDPDILEGNRGDPADDQDRPGAGSEADSGITGLSILAFQAGGQTHYHGPYRVHVQRGLEYLIRKQGRDGSLAAKASPYAAMYCHGMATLALAEAVALTNDQRIKPYLERAVAYTLAAQHPSQGGWRYRPGDMGDMSQFGWQVMALKSAAAAGVDVPVQAHNRMQRFLSQSSMGPRGGLAAYRVGERATPPMTAEALACRLFFGAERSDPAVQEATEYLVDHLPRENDRINLYYWYYGTLALYQVQGEAWQRWNGVVRERLLASQELEGDDAGSWDTSSQWGGYGGRAFTTSLAALCLQSYYRFAAIDEELHQEREPEVNVAERPGWTPR